MSLAYDKTFKKVRKKIMDAYDLFSKIYDYPVDDKTVGEMAFFLSVLASFYIDVSKKIVNIQDFLKTIKETENPK